MTALEIIATILLWIGFIIVVGTHIYLLTVKQLPADQVVGHAIINLSAAVCILAALFLKDKLSIFIK